MNLFNAGLVAVVLGAAGYPLSVGDLQGALCSPGVEALGEEQFSTLVAALERPRMWSWGYSTNQNLVLVAPTNDAFAAALKAAQRDSRGSLDDTDTLASILSVHVGFAESPEATTAVDVAKSSLMFMVDGQESSLESTWPVDGEQVAGGVSIMGPVNTADVASVIRCVGGEQTLFAADSVLLPESLAPTPTPTPTPTPPTPAGSAPATSMLVSAGALVLGALQFL
eukprot:jgi/Picre1/28427/NNA_003831.t1